MLENRIRLIPLDEIIFPPARFREKIVISDLVPLASNIIKLGLLQNIGVDEDTMELVFGGRRFHAMLLIHAAYHNETNEVSAEVTAEQLTYLHDLAHATPRYDKWTKVPTRLGHGLSKLSLSAMEFVENIREGMSWQENAAAVVSLHQQAQAEAALRHEKWGITKTAALLGITQQYASDLIRPAKQLQTLPKELHFKAKEIMEVAPSASRAAASIADMAERHGHKDEPRGPKIALKQKLTPTVPKPPKEPLKPTHSPGTELIHNSDFLLWPQTYAGPLFNFVHCDFPYGKSFNVSRGSNTSAATRQVGTYDDSAEIYWSLLESLLAFRSKILSPSCHIMFWLDADLSIIQRTMTQIKQAWPDAKISRYLLIWHCSDNAGIAADYRNEPRHIYENALQITLGDRPLVQVKSDTISYPRNVDKKIHRSQKHLDVLRHFFRMFVDESTIMLDPTCGSATSLIAARKLKAKSISGLEKDPEMYKAAIAHFDKETYK